MFSSQSKERTGSQSDIAICKVEDRKRFMKKGEVEKIDDIAVYKIIHCIANRACQNEPKGKACLLFFKKEEKGKRDDCNPEAKEKPWVVLKESPSRSRIDCEI